ncbi:MAG: hypothetical protein NVS2B17_23390 [Candidatus Velthaea sp.]
MLFGIAAILNVPWEVLQTPFYTLGAPISMRHVITCVLMGLVDAGAIVGVSLVVIAGLSRLPVRGRNAATYAALFVVGALAAVGGESVALVFGWWTYSQRMPTIFGLGVLPILQLAILSPLAFYLATRLNKRTGNA